MKIIFVLGLLTTFLALLNGRGVSGGVTPFEEPEDEPPVWDNLAMRDFGVNCACGYALYRVRSEYNEDLFNWRLWDWDCRQVSDNNIIVHYSMVTHLHTDQLRCKR